MDVIAIIGIVGAIASLIGAFLSIRSEREAKSSAEKAEIAKNIILRKQGTTKMAELLFESKSIQRVFGKYSIATASRGLPRDFITKDGEMLKDYIFKFNDNRQLLEISTEIETQAVYDELNKLLKDFISAKMSVDKNNLGNQVRISMDDIIFKLNVAVEKRNIEVEI